VANSAMPGGLHERFGLFGNQQFPIRNLTFYNAVTAIQQSWGWGWTYKSIIISNCSGGLNMSAINSTTGAQSVGSITFIDSSISDTPVGIKTAYSATSKPPTRGSLIVENLSLKNVPITIQGPRGSIYLVGSSGSLTIVAWG
jgi:glucan 1,3-beta-glucosidase